MKKTNSYYFVLIALYFYNLVVLRVSSTFNEFGCRITTFFLYCKKYYKENQHYATFFHKSIKKDCTISQWHSPQT